jgi:hypothetical protein
LVQLGARQYDKSIGRFISVDSFIDMSDLRQMNGYAYANHNPVSYNDSDGNFVVVIAVPVIVVVFIIVVLLVMMMQAYQQSVTTVSWEEKIQNVWDVLKWAWHSVVKLVKVVTTVIVTLWRMITVAVMSVVAKMVVIYHTIIKHYADKKKPRNNSKAKRNDGKSNNQNRGNQNRGNQNRGNQGKPKAQDGPAKPQPPRQQPRPQQPKKPKGPAQQERVLGPEPAPDAPIYRGTKPNINPNELPRSHYKLDENGMVKPTAGMSVDTNAAKLLERGWNPKLIDRSTISPRLMIRQTGNSGSHYEIMPRVAGDLSEADFLGLLNKIKIFG